MRRLVVVVAACGMLAAGCSLVGSRGTPVGGGWVDQQVRFQAGGVTVQATYRHPRQGGAVPAALLIAGSGPTDRDGNDSQLPHVDTLHAVAGWLSSDGVASLRYDKLGSGRTGLGKYARDPAGVGVAPFQQEAAAGLDFLAGQHQVRRDRLVVVGHSEGALYALMLATGAAGHVPPIHALALLEPASRRFLDTLAGQLEQKIAAQVRSGQLGQDQATQLDGALTGAVEQLRTQGTVPANLPGGLSNVLPAVDARYDAEVDRYDPAELIGRVPAGTPMLLSCSDADIQITCADVQHLAGGAAAARPPVDLVQLTGVDHILKEDGSRTGDHYDDPLPFSARLATALAAFTHRSLG